MLSMAFARSWARKLDTYSWSFFSSRAKTFARPLRAEEERVARRRRAALRACQRERREED